MFLCCHPGTGVSAPLFQVHGDAWLPQMSAVGKGVSPGPLDSQGIFQAVPPPTTANKDTKVLTLGRGRNRDWARLRMAKESGGPRAEECWQHLLQREVGGGGVLWENEPDHCNLLSRHVSQSLHWELPSQGFSSSLLSSRERSSPPFPTPPSPPHQFHEAITDKAVRYFKCTMGWFDTG